MKNRILEYLFKGYSKSIKEEAERGLETKLEAYKATLDIKDLVRDRLKGVKPNNPDDNTILFNHLDGLDDASRLAFLSRAYDIVNNETFKIVIKSLIVESEHKAVLDSGNMEEVNFNRATVNGLMLLEEELNQLATQYKNEKEESKGMTENERYSAL